ncbi:Uncharacterised protein [Xylophilus ampelinus]|nr:DUF3253 domain-containing protein [Variovorax sp.]VTY23941.1 Uncharacterised protein [Xylophilus ampelinus]
MGPTDARLRQAITTLLAAREPPATICPSEVARAAAPDAWRPLMPRVRELAFAMAREGRIEVRQKGRPVPPDPPPRGPIRLGHALPAATREESHPTTPDGRYLVVRGRLWRKADPGLPDDLRQSLVHALMDARRALARPLSPTERRAARDEVDRVKQALGERGPVWWTDGAPDFNRRMAKNTPYRDWFDALDR